MLLVVLLNPETVKMFSAQAYIIMVVLYTYIHTYIHTHIHTYIHTYSNTWGFKSFGL
jgi:hypothetical protein